MQTPSPGDTSTGLAQLTALLADAEAKLTSSLTRLAADAVDQGACIERLGTLPEDRRKSLPDKLESLLASLTDRLKHDIAEASKVSSRVAGEAEIFRTSMQEVGSKSADIEDIAHRTRLVALNAAATAERAGTQGRAFGVIAQQVTELPIQAARLSLQIGELTRSAEAHLVSAVAALRKAADGSEAAAEETQAQLEQLRGRLGPKNDALRTGIEQVGRACRAIEGLSRTNLAALDRLRRATRVLESEASGMKPRP